MEPAQHQEGSLVLNQPCTRRIGVKACRTRHGHARRVSAWVCAFPPRFCFAAGLLAEHPSSHRCVTWIAPGAMALYRRAWTNRRLTPIRMRLPAGCAAIRPLEQPHERASISFIWLAVTCLIEHVRSRPSRTPICCCPIRPPWYT